MPLEWDEQHPPKVFLNRCGWREAVSLKPLAQPDREVFAEASLVDEVGSGRSRLEQISTQRKATFDDKDSPSSGPGVLARHANPTQLLARYCLLTGIRSASSRKVIHIPASPRFQEAH